ncbi:MAG TPA: hypothetical protein VJS11_04325 [Acidobacteriaceae bacterium]|nr:hypothetical protein [Acidobacteriaceae bacterium]
MIRARWWAEATGVALLALLPYFYPLLLPDSVALYHDSLPLRTLIIGVLVDIATLTVLCTLVLAFTSRLPERFRLIIGAIAVAGVLCRAEAVITIFLSGSQETSDVQRGAIGVRLIHLAQSAMSVQHSVAAGLALAFVLVGIVKPQLIRALMRVTRIGLAGFAFSMVWIAPELVYMAAGPADPPLRAGQAREIPVEANHTPQRRLVWILFDELSYRLVFERQPAGQEFSNFERLRERSYSFSDVKPVGFYTDRIIPSLFVGTEIDKIRSSVTGDLEYLGPRERRWKEFDPDSSLFGLAQRDRWNPGVAGWSNPYCRILRPVLNECFWQPADAIPLEDIGASSNHSATQNALALPRYALTRLLAKENSDSPQLEHLIQGYIALMGSARTLIRDPHTHFVFVHLPVPHPPGIYDRRGHRLRPGGNYLDNLTLADDTLAQLMQEIQASADADDTTVIVSSDHSWRVPLWDSTPDWTKEEEEISRDTFDPRPVFLIHFPGETNGVDIRSAMPELEEHDIIAGILNGHIENGSQMAALLHTEKIRFAGNEEERSEAGQ